VTCDGGAGAVATPTNTAFAAGSSSAQRASSQAYGSALVFGCSAGYSGTVTYTCGQSGQFSAQGQCAAVTCDGGAGAVATPTNTAFAAGSSSAQRASSQAYGSALVFGCSVGHIGNITYTCTADGFFNVTAAGLCTSVNCDGSTVRRPSYCDPTPHGTGMQSSGQPMGSTIIFDCSIGFNGTVTYTCGGSGLFTTKDTCTPLQVVVGTSSQHCVLASGLSHHVELVATGNNGLHTPRDLAFSPTHIELLWVANNATDSLTLINTTAGPNSAVALEDRAPFHYMDQISALAFAPNGFFATCQDSRNTYDGRQSANDFMGPTLYDGSFSELVNSRAQPCDLTDPHTTCFFTHFDMLHETPQCKGIAHDHETVTPFGNVYWVFDGHDNMLVRYDFQEPHGPGSLDHSRASIRRFEDVVLTPVPGLPSHLMMDPSERVIYIADTGTGRVLRVDPDSGRFLRNARWNYTIYSSMASTFEYSIYTCTRQDVFASGLHQPVGLHVDANFVYVSEYATSRIVVFDKSSGARVSHIDTGAVGLLGIAMDARGQLWFADGTNSTVGKIVVDTPCAAMHSTAHGPSRLSWAPNISCDVQPLQQTATDTARWHDLAFLNTHDANSFPPNYPANYSNMTVDQCDLVNFDILLMEGYICHICLPDPCRNGGRCVHHSGTYTMGGFSCNCAGTQHHGDICQFSSPLSSLGPAVQPQPRPQPVQQPIPQPVQQPVPQPVPQPAPQPQPAQSAEVLATIAVPGAVRADEFVVQVLTQLPAGASVQVTKYEQTATASATMPGTIDTFQAGFAAWSEFIAGTAAAAGVPSSAVTISGVADSGSSRRVLVNVDRRRHMQTDGVTITYDIISTDPSTAAAVATKLGQPSAFTVALVSSINAAGAAIPPLTQSDVVVAKPQFKTAIAYTVSIDAEDASSASTLATTIAATTLDERTMINLADAARMFGTPPVTSVVVTNNRAALISQTSSADSEAATLPTVQSKSGNMGLYITLAAGCAIAMAAAGMCGCLRKLRKGRARERCSPGQRTQYGTQGKDDSPSKQTVSGMDIEAPRSHVAVTPTLPAERRRHAPREDFVSIRRAKSGFGMVLQEGCYVSHVDAGGQADRSGLKVGSVIRSVDGNAVTKLADAVRLLQQFRYREVVRVGFMPPPRMRMTRRSGRGETVRSRTPPPRQTR
jgi:sugar lactone lactonase YvrE